MWFVCFAVLAAASCAGLPLEAQTAHSGGAIGSGFSFPTGVAVDGNGNVFVADTLNNAVKKIDLSDPPSVNFATATKVGFTDTTDGPQTVTVANSGNAPLIRHTYRVFAAGEFDHDHIAQPQCVPDAVGRQLFLQAEINSRPLRRRLL